MVKILKILIFALLGLLSADYHPEGGEAFNYTHIYFQWDQIPDAEWYNLSLINVDSGDEYEVETQSNSNLVLDFIQWNSTFSWEVTAINENGEYYYLRCWACFQQIITRKVGKLSIIPTFIFNGIKYPMLNGIICH